MLTSITAASKRETRTSLANAEDASLPSSLSAAGDRSVAISHNSGIVNTGDHTTFVDMAAAATRLEDAYLSPASLWRELKLGRDFERFTGRAWLIDEVDSFTAASESGWFLIEGDAGVGKTAFASVLSARQDLPHHFCGLPSGGAPGRALRSLAAQIIEREGLAADLGTAGLPDEASTPEWFDVMLSAAVERRRSSGNGAPIVLVIDALEDAELVRGMPFGLPRSLPKGVCIVATRRLGSHPLPLEGDVHITHLRASDPRNLRDVEEMLRKTAEDPKMVLRLAAAGVETEWFIDTLMTRCGGVWIYLHYVESEIRLGLRRVDELESLPSGLWSYYAQTLASSRLQSVDLWDEEVRGLLVVIGTVMEPVSFPLACAFAEVTPVPRLRRLLDGPWRPFLMTIDAHPGEETRYAPLHTTFREFVRGELNPRAAEVAVDRGLVRELSEAGEACERRIIETYLASWGGLEAGLPMLSDNPPQARGELDAYGWRNVAAHLIRGQREGDLHKLLGLSRDGENVWFAAHEAAGDLAGYWSDLEIAWRAAETSNDRLVAEGEEPRYSLEARCVLIASTLRTIAHQFPPSLLATLVRESQWTMAQALAYARRIVDPMTRLVALVELACVEAKRPIRPDRRVDLFGRLLDDDADWPSENMLFEALDGAKMASDSEIRAELVKLARQCEDAPVQLIVWTTLAPILRPEEIEELALQALEVDEIFAPRIITELVARMPPKQAERLVPRLIDAVARGEAADLGTTMRAALCQVVDRQYARRLAGEAVERASQGDSGDSGDWDWSVLVLAMPHLEEAWIQDLLDELRDMPSLEGGQASVLGPLARRLSPADRAALLPLLLKIDDEDARASIFAEVACLLPEDALGETLEECRKLDDWGRALVIAGLPRRPAALYMGDLGALAMVSPARLEMPSFPGIASLLPDELLDEALVIVLEIEDLRALLRSLGAMLPRFPPARATEIAEALLEEACSKGASLLEETGGSGREEIEDELLASVETLLPYLEEEGIERAVTVCGWVEPIRRCLLTKSLCQQIGVRASLIAAALEALGERAEAEELMEEDMWVVGLLAPYVPDDQIESALEISTRPSLRRKLLPSFASRLSPERLRRALDEEFREMGGQWDDVNEFVEDLLPGLDDSGILHLAELSQRIGDDDEWVSALVQLMPMLDRSHRELLLRVGQDIPDSRQRANLLSPLVHHIDQSLVPEVCKEVVDACLDGAQLARFYPYTLGTPYPLASLVPLLEPSQLERVEDAAESSLASLAGRWPWHFYDGWESLYVALAARASDERINALAETFYGLPQRRRPAAVLFALVPRLGPEGRRRAVEEAAGWNLVRRARLLAMLPVEEAEPHAAACWRQASHARRWDVGEPLVSVLPASEVDAAVEQACGRPDHGESWSFIGPLIPRLSDTQIEQVLQCMGEERIPLRDFQALLDHLPEAGRLAMARRVFDDGKPQVLGSRGRVVKVLPYLAEREREQAVEHLLAQPFEGSRRMLLEEIAPYISQGQALELDSRECPKFKGRLLLSRYRPAADLIPDLRPLLNEHSRSGVMQMLAEVAYLPAELENDFADRLAELLIEIRQWRP